MLKINNLRVQSPSALEVSLFEVGDASRRNAAGEQVIDHIAMKRRIRAEWSIMDREAMAELFSAVNDLPFFPVQYPDPVTGEERTAVCSCSRQSGGVLRMESGGPVWKGVAMTWIER